MAARPNILDGMSKNAVPSNVSFSHAYTSQRPPENNSVPQTSMAGLKYNRAEWKVEGLASQIHRVMGQQQRAWRAALITQAVRKTARSSKMSGVNTTRTDTHKLLSAHAHKHGGFLEQH